MRIRSNFFPAVLTRQFIFIGLLGAFLSGGLVFAQDWDRSIGTKINPEYLVLITSSKPLNVRQEPTVLSQVVASLPSGSKVPFIKSGGEGDWREMTAGKANWYQLEYEQGRFGWVTKDFSRKIKKPANKPTLQRVARVAKLEGESQIAKLESESQAPVEKVKPVAKTNQK